MAHTYVPDLPASFVAVVREWRAEVSGKRGLFGKASGSVLAPIEGDPEEQRWALFGPAWCWGQWVDSPCLQRWRQRHPEDFLAAVAEGRLRVRER